MKIRHLASALAIGAALALTGCAAGSAPSATAQQAAPATASPEWVKAIAARTHAKQLFVVAGIGQTTAYVSMHEQAADGTWQQVVSTPGYIGKKGLGKTKEGDAMTPVGTFHFNRAFGIAADPGCTAFAYHQVTPSDYWSGDVRPGRHYNEMVTIEQYPDLNTSDSEHLIDYLHQYQYALNVSYNEQGKAGLGSAIFLHCLGDQKPYTGGCIAIPRDQMETVMRRVKPDCVVVIDTLAKISPELKKAWNL
ncbi:MAG: L,D-transpeptidase family protein [Succinivibrionaceae bacterium]|nr:L,D-transpeptidase family protein [Succinivibrionaceae bacterium]